MKTCSVEDCSNPIKGRGRAELAAAKTAKETT